MEAIKYIGLVILIFICIVLFLGKEKLFGVSKETRKKRALQSLIVVLCLVLGGLLILAWNYWNYQRNLSLCQDRCFSISEGWKFSDPNIPLIKMTFSTQEECIEFCSSLLRDLQKEEWKSIDLKSLY
ncbi:hypothetical protein J7K24_00370 [bacterium]|nr:hypothetical protein [bacterium]